MTEKTERCMFVKAFRVNYISYLNDDCIIHMLLRNVYAKSILIFVKPPYIFMLNFVKKAPSRRNIVSTMSLPLCSLQSVVIKLFRESINLTASSNSERRKQAYLQHGIDHLYSVGVYWEVHALKVSNDKMLDLCIKPQ